LGVVPFISGFLSFRGSAYYDYIFPRILYIYSRISSEVCPTTAPLSSNLEEAAVEGAFSREVDLIYLLGVLGSTFNLTKGFSAIF
jgi:hypothetical protein